MKSRIEKLIFQLENVFKGTPYYGESIKGIIDQITFENINTSVGEGHSIAQIIKHMLAWRLFAIEHLKGNLPPTPLCKQITYMAFDQTVL